MARHQDGQAMASFWLVGLAEHQGLRAGEHLGTGCTALHADEPNKSLGDYIQPKVPRRIASMRTHSVESRATIGATASMLPPRLQ